MAAKVIDGNVVAKQVRGECAAQVAALKAQLKAAQPEKVEAVKRPAVKKAAKRG